jgi:hypothetical protein
MKKQRLNRRRYSEVVKLLKSVIADEKQPIERRMRAADRLLDVYDRADKIIERRAREAARAEAVEPAGSVAVEQTQDAPELTAEQQAEAFLEKMRSRVYAS